MKKSIIGFVLPGWKNYFRVNSIKDKDSLNFGEIYFPYVVVERTRHNCSRTLYKKGVKIRITIEDVKEGK